jgi:hypothetical protein
MKKLELERLFLIGSQIEELVQKHELAYIDACLMYCEQNDFEIELIGEILKSNQFIKAKIQKEAENLNYIKKEQRLPLTLLNG